MSCTPVAEHLAVELSLPVFMTGIWTSNLLHGRQMLWLTVPKKECLNMIFLYNVKKMSRIWSKKRLHVLWWFFFLIPIRTFNPLIVFLAVCVSSFVDSHTLSLLIVFLAVCITTFLWLLYFQSFDCYSSCKVTWSWRWRSTMRLL